MKRSHLLLAGLLVVSVLVGWQLPAQNPLATKPLKPFMQHKLEHSKAILEGLALEDFDKIAKHSQDLSLLSLESTWNVLSTEEYLQQSTDFRRAIKVVIDAAHEKNVDRAALGYVNMTVRCVECHKYLRKQHSIK